MIKQAFDTEIPNLNRQELLAVSELGITSGDKASDITSSLNSK